MLSLQLSLGAVRWRFEPPERLSSEKSRLMPTRMAEKGATGLFSLRILNISLFISIEKPIKVIGFYLNVRNEGWMESVGFGEHDSALKRGSLKYSPNVPG